MTRREIRDLTGQLRAVAVNGAVTLDDANRAGIAGHRLARAARVGALHRLAPGLYSLRPHPADRARHHIKRLRERGIEAILGGVSAARVWDVPVFGSSGALEDEPLTLLVPRGAEVRRGQRHGVRLRVADVAASDITVVDGIPVTCPIRTGLDVARDLGRCRASALIPLSGGVRAEAARPLSRGGVVSAHDVTQRLLSETGLREELLAVLRDTTERVNAHGMRWVRRVLPDIEPLLETALEGLVWAALTTADLPRPVPQRWVRGASGRWYRVDFLIGEWVILEADGAVKYADQTPWQEKQRQSDLEAAGYWVVRCTWDEALRHSEEVVGRVRVALRRSTTGVHAPARARSMRNATVRDT